MIVAKFKCESVTKYEGNGEQVKLRAAYGKGNESWSAATPSGVLELAISNPEGSPGRYCHQCERDADINYALTALPVVALAFALTALLTSALWGSFCSP